MTSFAHKSDPRRRQYARFAQSVIEALREAVDRRTGEGLSKREIANRIDMNPSSLTRILNGRVKNITIKTISDILWAAEHEPKEFGSDALEDLSPNYRPEHIVLSQMDASVIWNTSASIMTNAPEAPGFAAAPKSQIRRIVLENA